MAEQPEFRPPNFTIQEASQYKADIDSSVKLLGRIAAAFAAHEKPSVAEVSEVTTIGDSGGDLDGAWFTINAPSQGFYVFFSDVTVSGILDPGLSGLTGIQVDYTQDDAAATIAAAMNTAIDAQALLNSSVSGNVVTISNRDQGAVDDLGDGASGNATGFGLVVVTQGGDGPTDLQVNIDAGFVLNDPLASGNNGLEEIAAQIISEGSGSILAPSVNPRIDRIVIDIATGVAELVGGAEAASPVVPDIPSGKAPNCQFRLETSTSIITNSLIIEERAIVEYGVTFTGVETDSSGTGEKIKFKILNIGDWDMDADTTKTVNHELTRNKIRTISALIQDDTEVVSYDLGGSGTTGTLRGALLVNVNSIQLDRTTGGLFDSTAFDLVASGFNRGWIFITYAL